MGLQRPLPQTSLIMSKESSRRKKRRRYESNKNLIRALKNQPCADCDITYPHYVMDFDHRDPKDKTANVAALKSRSPDAILFEISKCDLVCANCHRIRTHGSN